MDYKKLLTGLLSKAYKLDNGKIAELLKEGEEITEDDVLNALLDEDSNRVAGLKEAGNTTGKFQEGYAKAKKEVLSALEAELKTKFEFESDKTGLDLVDEIVSFKLANVGTGKKGEVTEDDVKKHPAYQSLESKYKTDLKKKEEEWSGKLEEIQEGYKKKEVFGSVKNKALVLLDSLKPVLPSNANVAANQKEWFVRDLEGYEYDTQGDRIVVMKDGKVLEDKHGHSIGFDDFVKSTASNFFEFQKNNGGGNANNREEEGGNGGEYPAGIQKPKTIEELTKIVNDKTLKLEDRNKVMEVWEKENG